MIKNIIIAILAFCLSIVIILNIVRAVSGYIAGKYGNKCYIESQQNGNIKYPIQFNSLEECLEFTNQQPNE